MAYVLGFAIWIVIGLIAATVIRTVYAADLTATWLSYMFGFFGAFVGGMLAASGYVYHDPSPLRIGSIMGAILGSFMFTYLYHLVARKGV